MLSKSSFFTTILLLLPALASAQTADDDLQLELRYYAPKQKFTSHGIVPAAYSNFRDTLNIKNGNAPEYRLSGKNWYVDYIAIHEKGYASHHIPAQGSLVPADSRTKLNLDYASFNYSHQNNRKQPRLLARRPALLPLRYCVAVQQSRTGT